MPENSLYNDLRDNEIRLIELLPGDSEEQIQCRLIRAALDDRPHYEAISYVWGDPAITDTILCNDQVMDITVNLVQALRRLRPRHGEMPSRTLWVDAICIDQSNLAERSKQVPLMAHIYSSATRVVVWTGIDDTEVVATAIAAIHYVHSAYVRFIGNKTRVDPASDPADYLNIIDLETHMQKQSPLDLWTSVQILFSVPYWQRVWCIQEVDLAQELIILVDSKEIVGEAIAIFVEWYVRRITKGLAEGLNYDHSFLPILVIGRANLILNYSRWRLPAQLDLFSTLEDFRPAHATDPKDKVYGLLGIHAKHMGEQAAIHVNYEKSAAEVYIETVLLGIWRSGSTSVLSCVDHGREYDANTAYPSWVPRWDRPRTEGQQFLLNLSTPSFAGCKIAANPDEQLALSGILKLQGMSFDEVLKTSTILPGATWLERDPDFKELFSQLWSEVNTPDSTYPHHISTTELATTITAGIRAISKDVVEDGVLVQDYYKALDDLDSDHGRQFFSDFESFVQMIDPPDFSLDSSNGNGRAFAELAGSLCCNRRIFRTRRGYLGLGPSCMQEGDFVVVFDAGPIPYILRPLTGSTYAYMGECFVWEIRNGQIYGMTDEDSVREQVFELH